MKKIADLLARDLRQKIEEIIKVDQTDKQSVYAEITEYVATDRIKGQFRDLLREIAEAPQDPHEGIGVWISGFFGSGKSSFSKNLGYVLANPDILGTKASALFKAQVNDTRISELIDFINIKIPTKVIMFDVSVDRAVKRATERLAEIMYTVLLRELDYAEDFDVAELEIELEKEGKLPGFVNQCLSTYNLEWRIVRKGAQKISRASAILHTLDPATYPTPDAWSQSLRDKRADITVGKLVERTFELCARRRADKALVFIIDEVGQYVARSEDKIEDLRAIVEQFGVAGKNLIKARKAVAPVWVVVTSQEKLDEIVSAIGSKRIELARLQDRFKYRIDLSPADIREVATRRVLAKKKEAIPLLKKLFNESQGQLNAACRLERTSRKSEITESDFIQFYPYLPHFVELSIDIMSGIRIQPGAPKHFGGSNRTIIKQAYEMLVHPRTDFAHKPIGRLIALDQIFELVEGNLPDLKRNDLEAIRLRLDNPDSGNIWPSRVAKAICLLEFVRDLPRTEENIAAVLVDEVGQPSPLTEVKEALKRLEEADFIIQKDEGYELLTPADKNWHKEKKSYLAPKPKYRKEIMRDTLLEIFDGPKLKTYRFRDLRSFQVGLTIDGNRVGSEGHVPLSMIISEDDKELSVKLTMIRDESRQEVHKDDVYWTFALNPVIDDFVANLYASRQMVEKYEHLKSQRSISNEDIDCLQNEKNITINLQNQLRDKTIEALQAGTGFFRGVPKDGADLGKTVEDIFKKLFDFAVPDLYPKLEVGARPLKGNEAEEILKAANLNALSQVFYSGEQGLNLVIKEGAKFIPNPAADVAKEVLDYLNIQHSYGEKESRTGKSLEAHFGGLGYGWDRDMIRLILAVLLRAGAIEVSYGGQRFDSYQDPRCRVPFTNNLAFKSALFTPAKLPDLKILTQAVRNYEELTGLTVDVDKNAIASAFKGLAEEELKFLLPLEAKANAHSLPVVNCIEESHAVFTSVQQGSADDCVRILAGEGKSLKDERNRIRKIGDATNERGLTIIRCGRLVMDEMWPILSQGRLRFEDQKDDPAHTMEFDGKDLEEKARELAELLEAEDFYEYLDKIKRLSDDIRKEYEILYSRLHQQRTKEFMASINEIKGRPEWASVSEDMQVPLLAPLTARACETSAFTLHCDNCRASIPQMESDLAASSGLKAQVISRIQELTVPRDNLKRVRLSEFFSGAIASEEAVDNAVESLREYLMKLIAEGAKIIVE